MQRYTNPRGWTLPLYDEVADDDAEDVRVDVSGGRLYGFRWSRIVLDEAHRIKGAHDFNRTSSVRTAREQAMVPVWHAIQNRIGELYALVRFLRVFPFSHFFCKQPGCDCASLYYAFDNTANKCLNPNCNHVKGKHVSYFNNQIQQPIMTYGSRGIGRIALKALQDDILGRCMLRRTKVERADDVKLKPSKS